MAALFISFLLSGHWKEKARLLKHPLIVMAIAIFIWEIISVLYSAGSWQESLNIALKYNKMFIVWCMVYFINGNIKRFYSVMAALIAGCVLNLLAIYVNYFFLPPDYAIAFVRANWPSAQGHGQFALFTLILAFSFLVASGIKSIPKHWRYTLFVTGFLALVAEIFLNSSRTGYVMEFTILFCLLLQARRLWPFLGILTAIAIIFGGAYFISPIFKQRVDVAVQDFAQYHSGESNTTSGGYRLYFYTTSLNIMLQNPANLIFGHGAGSYEQVTNTYIDELKHKNPNFTYEKFPNPHNQYILFLFENGIIGLLIFLAFLYTIWRYARKLPFLWKNVAWVALIGMMVNMLFNSAFMDFPTAIIFMPVIGFLASYLPKATFKSISNKPTDQ